MNDAIGGVDVAVLEDMTWYDWRYVQGNVVHLEGNMALDYVRQRDEYAAGSNMGKFKKLTAVILTALLIMSMSMTVLAKESVTDPDIPVAPPTTDDDSFVAAGYDKDGNVVEVTVSQVAQEVADILKDEDKVKDIFKGAGLEVKDDMKFVVIGMNDLSVEEMPEGGIDLNYYGASFDEDIKPGDTVYVMHQKHDGTWEIFSYVVDENGTIKLHLDSLSPVAFVKVLSDGRVVVLDEQEKVVAEVKDGKTVPASVKTSPKTGA